MNTGRHERDRGRLVVFSDLDETLLDRHDYSHDKAGPGLALLRERDIPLVLCTSKTRPEVEFHRGRLDNRHPFVVENGGAVYIPADYFDFDIEYNRRTGDYLVVELGTPYRTLVGELARLREKTGLPLRGFSDMSAREISIRCGLSLDQANLAKQREYDEPFLIPPPSSAAMLSQASHIPLTRGGRFFHLATGDKGRAVSMLMKLFRRRRPDTVSIGIGDAHNDLALFKAVDIPVLVQDAEGGYDPELAMPGLHYAKGIGPVGWNAAITSLA